MVYPICSASTSQLARSVDPGQTGDERLIVGAEDGGRAGRAEPLGGREDGRVSDRADGSDLGPLLDAVHVVVRDLRIREMLVHRAALRGRNAVLAEGGEPVVDRAPGYHRGEARLATVIPGRSVDDWLAAFGEHGVPAAKCRTMDEHLADPQVAHNDVYRIEEWPQVGPVRTVRYPAVLASTERLCASGPAAVLGADNESLITGLPRVN